MGGDDLELRIYWIDDLNREKESLHLTLEVPRYTHVVVLSRALIITSLCKRNDDVMRPGQLHLALPFLI